MRAVVDRIENQTAVLLFGDKEIKVNMPLKLLPAGTREGSFLQVDFTLDREGEAAQREKISNLLDKLTSKSRQDSK